MLLDVSRDRDGFYVFQALKAGALTPVQEPANRMTVRTSGVLVSDWDGKDSKKRLAAFGPTSAAIAGTWNDPAPVYRRIDLHEPRNLYLSLIHYLSP
jgi:hypothetical protein